MKVTRRPATDADTPFAREAHHAAYREAVVRQFGQWDEAKQDDYFARDWADAEGAHHAVPFDGAALMAMIRGLVFDFDGLILDTEGPEYAAWCEVFGEHGCELKIEDWSAGIGTQRGFDPYRHLEALIGRPISRDELRPRVRQRLLALITQEVVKPGVIDYLDDAARLELKVGLASSADREWVTGHLTRLQLLDRFQTIRTWEEGKRPKPAPDLYLAALDGLGLAPEEAVALEDSPNGLAAAKAAGLFCVAVPSGPTATLDFSAADMVVPSLASLRLTELIARAEGRPQ